MSNRRLLPLGQRAFFIFEGHALERGGVRHLAPKIALTVSGKSFGRRAWLAGGDTRNSSARMGRCGRFAVMPSAPAAGWARSAGRLLLLICSGPLPSRGVAKFGCSRSARSRKKLLDIGIKRGTIPP